MDAKHTTEPWKVYENDAGWQSEVCGSDGDLILSCVGFMKDAEANASRAAACVNKLAGHADLDAVEVVNAAAIQAAREALEEMARSNALNAAHGMAVRALAALGGGK